MSDKLIKNFKKEISGLDEKEKQEAIHAFELANNIIFPQKDLKIALCMITKGDDEIEELTQSLKSAILYVDGIFITANGKQTKQTEELITKLKDIYPEKEIEYSYLVWKKDFSAQRNFNFSRVPNGYDYIYWQDCDDYLIGGEYLKTLAKKALQQKKDVVFLKYWYGCEFDLRKPAHVPGAPRVPDPKPSPETFVKVDIEHYRERLIRPGTVYWKGRLHETPVPVSGQKDNYAKVRYDQEKDPIAVMHTALIGDAMDKMPRNKEILELQLQEEGDNPDPRTLLYLMKIYAEIAENNEEGIKLLNKTIKYGKIYLEKSGWDEERANANDLMAICSTKMGKYKDAIKYLHKAIEEYPHQPLHYIRLSLAYYNNGQFSEARHWLSVAGQLDMRDQTAGINNIKEIKVLFAQMLLKIKYNVEKDLRASVEAAKILLNEQPTYENQENLLFLMDLLDLHNASVAAKSVLNYLEDIGAEDKIPQIIQYLPESISDQPWCSDLRKNYIKPKIWADNEICYFANFGGKHFEKWDGNSVKDGIGGSETAVIRLSEEWVKQGYKVTVFGDPQASCEINGVTYLPWHHFNPKDEFNVFIQWRSPHMIDKVDAKKKYIDLHDIWHPVDYSEKVMNEVDGIMVKSEYHKELAGDLLQNYRDKFIVIGNGIDTGDENE